MKKQTWLRNPEIVYRTIDQEAILVDSRQGMVTVLNQTGSRIWQMLDGKTDYNRMVEIIADEFDVDANTAREDVKQFIDSLTENNMVIQQNGLQ